MLRGIRVAHPLFGALTSTINREWGIEHESRKDKKIDKKLNFYVYLAFRFIPKIKSNQ